MHVQLSNLTSSLYLPQTRHMTITWIRNLRQGDPGYDALDKLANQHLTQEVLDSVSSAVSMRMGNSVLTWQQSYDRFQQHRCQMFAGKISFAMLLFV
jgi:hypothetical protein